MEYIWPSYFLPNLFFISQALAARSAVIAPIGLNFAKKPRRIELSIISLPNEAGAMAESAEKRESADMANTHTKKSAPTAPNTMPRLLSISLRTGSLKRRPTTEVSTLKITKATTNTQLAKTTIKSSIEIENLNNADNIMKRYVKNKSEQKIKKNGNSLTIELVENPDILKEMSAIKRQNQVVVGFCAESENLLEYAKAKITKKACDFICANDISKKDIGFSSNDNELYIIDRELNIYHIEKTDKQTAALKILEKIYGTDK